MDRRPDPRPDSQPAARPDERPDPGLPRRAPLRVAELRAVLVRPGGLWTEFRVPAETDSTSSDVAAAARGGAAEGLVVAAEHQRAGRGRVGRSWTSPPRAGLAVSLLLRPGGPGAAGAPVPQSRWGWLPLLAGVALAEAVAGHVRLDVVAGHVRADVGLKWPNDLLLGGRKVAGILAEVTQERAGEAGRGAGEAGREAGETGAAVVIGVGLNVDLRADELPPAAAGAVPATSLALAGAPDADRSALLEDLLRGVERWYRGWRAAAGDPERSGLRDAYLRRSATVGRQVRALLPDGTELTGIADTVDVDGRLVLRTAAGSRSLAAADITHLRPVVPG